MTVLYSFVIDGDPKFYNQTLLFLTTLVNGGVRPSQIVAHYTSSASDETKAVAFSFGIDLLYLGPIIDERYCDKLAQLNTLMKMSADMYVLCDTDLAFVENIEPLLGGNSVRAKPVDLPNPPIHILSELRAAFGIEQEPRIIKTSCADAVTFSTNCNAGFYIIPSGMAPAISSKWTECVDKLPAYRETLGSWYTHIDQIGFALAMLMLGYDIEEIPIEYNFPMHLAERLNSIAFEEPKVLHYRWLQDADGFLQRMGNGLVDSAVGKVNVVLARREEKVRAVNDDTRVFAYWDGEDRTAIAEFMDHWSGHFPGFHVYGNDEVASLLRRHFPEHADIFSAIQIPAAKADIARLVVLYEFGGLYVDCHSGIRDADAMQRLIGMLADFECVFFDINMKFYPRPPEEHALHNGILLSRPNSNSDMDDRLPSLVKLGMPPFLRTENWSFPV